MTRQPPPTWILLTLTAVLFSAAAVIITTKLLWKERPVPYRAPESTVSVISRRSDAMVVGELEGPGPPRDVVDSTMEGTLLVLRDHQLHENLSGTFVACFPGHFLEDGGWIRQEQRVPVTVTEGHWRIEGLTGITWFRVEDLELEQGPPAVVPRHASFSNEVRTNQILARAAPLVTLRVTDVRTGKDVPSFTLARAGAFRGRWSAALDIVPREMIFRRDLSSPTQLRAERASDHDSKWWQDVDYWVHAPGLTWKAIHVNFLEAEEVQVALAPGVDLSVTLRGVAAPPDTVRMAEVMSEREEAEQLQEAAWQAGDPDTARHLESRLIELEAERYVLHPEHTQVRKVELQVEQLPETTSRTLRRVVVGDGTFHFQGLPAARYRVRVALEASRQQVFAEQVVDARQYGAHEIALDVDPFPPPRELAPLSGLLYAGPSGKRPTITLDIEAADADLYHALSSLQIHGQQLSPYLDRPGWWSWDAGMVLQGRYSIESWGRDYSLEFEVGPEGNSTVLVELPPDS